MKAIGILRERPRQQFSGEDFCGNFVDIAHPGTAVIVGLNLMLRL
jgi:hypothetical protein